MTTRVVTTFWVDTFSADLVALAVGLSALAEHLEEGRWLFAGDDIHVPLNWVTSIVQSVPIPPYNKFRTVRIPRYYGTLYSLLCKSGGALGASSSSPSEKRCTYMDHYRNL